MSFVLVARMRCKEGMEDQAVATARELAEASRSEPGCTSYIPCRDRDDARTIIIFEDYRDEAAFEAHGATEHFQRLAVGELFPMMESRERTFYETL